MNTIPFGYDEKEDVILFGPLVLLYIEGVLATWGKYRTLKWAVRAISFSSRPF